jgi:hypothetical protein
LKKGNFQFPFIISPTAVYIQLKLKIWICHKNALVNFQFGHGLMIADRVIPLELWIKSEILSFSSLTLQWLYTFNSNLTYIHILGISSSSLNLVVVQWFWTKLSPLNVGKILNFQFQHSYFCGNVCSH